MKKIIKRFINLVFLLLVFTNFLWSGTNGGGPDAGGYSWINSLAPIPQIEFSWIEISGTGINTGISSDDGSAVINIGFSFSFYGNTYTTIRVSDNGYATFGIDGSDWSNDPIPDSTDPDNLLAVFWDDLNNNANGTIYYQQFGSAPDRSLVIEWLGIAHYGFGGAVTFEMILYENDNNIKFQYKDTIFGNIIADDGASATIGIENASGSEGTEYSYNTASINNDLAIIFSTNISFFLPPPPLPTPQWISAKPVALDKVELVWASIPGVTSYTLYRSTTEQDIGPWIASFTNNQTSYTDSGLECERPYYYRIRAFNATNFSLYSEVTQVNIEISLSTWAVLPTKFNPNTDRVAKIFFGGETPEVEVKIYDIFGNLVRFWSMDIVKGNRHVEWDGKDQNGIDVNAGIYIVYIEGKDIGKKKIRMMLVK